jgi:hypothetical protein
MTAYEDAFEEYAIYFKLLELTDYDNMFYLIYELETTHFIITIQTGYQNNTSNERYLTNKSFYSYLYRIHEKKFNKLLTISDYRTANDCKLEVESKMLESFKLPISIKEISIKRKFEYIIYGLYLTGNVFKVNNNIIASLPNDISKNIITFIDVPSIKKYNLKHIEEADETEFNFFTDVLEYDEETFRQMYYLIKTN